MEPYPEEGEVIGLERVRLGVLLFSVLPKVPVLSLPLRRRRVTRSPPRPSRLSGGGGPVTARRVRASPSSVRVGGPGGRECLL